ncbi:MAG: Fic family protein [Planctomycetia bacterium]|nr:Fic family protein [Planctomycetia bacterium]
MEKEWYSPLPLPASVKLDTPQLKTKLERTKKAFQEMENYMQTLSNLPGIAYLLAVLEAKDSLENEGVSTSFEKVFCTGLNSYTTNGTREVREVWGCFAAQVFGMRRIPEKGKFELDDLFEIERLIRGNTETLRNKALYYPHDGVQTYSAVPPKTPGAIRRLMDNLLLYVNNDSLIKQDPLLKAAIFHGQFRAIHPFPNGNCRTGRLFTYIYLYMKGHLHVPALCFSRILLENVRERNRVLYDILHYGKWDEWLLGSQILLTESARRTEKLARILNDFYQELNDKVACSKKIDHPEKTVQCLFEHPCLTVSHYTGYTNIIYQSAQSQLDILIGLKLVERKTIDGEVYYINRDLLRLLEDFSNQ